MLNQQVEYLIIGAGPAGLQLAYFLEMAQRSYLVLEAENSVGSFFKKFPRHGKLISINKVYTGYEDPEINLRWDWNSLISHDPALRLSQFSKDYFPNTSAFTSYLEAFTKRFKLNIRFNSKIVHVTKTSETFQVTDEYSNLYKANQLIIATGLSQPYVPSIPGIELAENYTTVSIDPQDFVDQRVLIIGKGNSGFETADNLISTASLIHIASPNPIRLAWKTKYVGHLRAINNNFLDTYQLKSQNGVLDAEITSIKRQDNKFNVSVTYTHAHGEQETLTYDRVIICTGFQFDTSLFDESCQPFLTIHDRFPAQTSEWESVNVPGLFFAGVLMHMRDFKKKQSGFVHGFRHNIQALHQILEYKYHQQSWPSQSLSATSRAITEKILDRVNSSAALWQQTGYLCDVVMINEDSQTAEYYQDVPRDYVHSSSFGSSSHYYIVTLEFGHDVDKMSDPFMIDRIHKDDAEHADSSEFIHPIIRRYRQNFLIDELHIIEDLEAEWKEPVHVEPLLEFFQYQLSRQLDSTSRHGSLPIADTRLASKLNSRSTSQPDQKRIGELLISAGLINHKQLNHALSEQKQVNLQVGRIMARHGWVNQQTVDFFVNELCLLSPNDQNQEPKISGTTH